MIEYQRFRHGESCTEEGCRARKFHIEDGKKFCQRGHEQAGFTQTQQDEDDFNTQGKTTRKKRQTEERAPTILSGAAAKGLYLQCIQLILWKQCYWLVTEKKMNAEVETIVRDLWRLRLGVIWDERMNAFSSQTGTDRSFFSSQGEKETEDLESDTEPHRRRRNRTVTMSQKLPRLLETLGLCYLAMVLARLPVSLGEVVGWAIRGEILYLRAIKAIPQHMRMRLPAQYFSSLEARAPLSGSALHEKTLDLVQFFHLHFEMVFPPLNVALLTYKHIRNLGLPIEIYPAVRRLANLLDLDFSFPDALASLHRPTSYPEVRLISLVVIATKLSQPFDDILRVPENDMDPSLLKISWKEWSTIMTDEETKGLKRGEEIWLKDTNVWDMNEKDIDQYLDWYQNTWMDDRNPKVSQQILDMFPLQDPEPNQTDDNPEICTTRLKKAREAVILQELPTLSEDANVHIRRPGELYKRYRKSEELEGPLLTFCSLAASNAGTSLDVLVKAVFQLEVQIEHWLHAERKKELLSTKTAIREDEEVNSSSSVN
ncbi:hypothetical protein K3495_g4362 [Podosphaera aphanis]|nr:hypothetical protein K3495_g4362 [Podosphaera aphanis]